MPTPSDTTTTAASTGMRTIDRHAWRRSRPISGCRAARSIASNCPTAAGACTPSPASARRQPRRRSGMFCFSSAETLSGPRHAVLADRQRAAHGAVLLYLRGDLDPGCLFACALGCAAHRERAVRELTLQRHFFPLPVVRRHQDDSLHLLPILLELHADRDHVIALDAHL